MKKINKNKDKPKKPTTAFYIYFFERKPKLIKKDPLITYKKLLNIVSKEYKTLSKKTKKYYKKLAKIEKKNYELKMKKWNKNNNIEGMKKSNERKKNERKKKENNKDDENNENEQNEKKNVDNKKENYKNNENNENEINKNDNETNPSESIIIKKENYSAPFPINNQYDYTKGNNENIAFEISKFVEYSTYRRAILTKLIPGISQEDITFIIIEEWNNLSEKEKKQYENKIIIY